MEVAVIGGLDRWDKDWIFSRLDEFVKPGDNIISGGARGVDSYAAEYAKSHDLNLIEFLPLSEDDKKGIDSYHARDERIAKAADIILAFPAKNSRGTYITIAYAKRFNKRVVIYELEKEKPLKINSVLG